MSIDAKGIQRLVWRIIRFSGICCYKFVRKYPVVSGFFISVFFLYICFPSVFYFLIYSSPILVGTVVSIRFYLKTKHPEFEGIKKKDSDERSSADVNRSNEDRSSADVNKSNVPSLRPQKSVRRNARMEVLEWDRKDSQVRDILFPTSPYENLSCKTNFLEENSRLIVDVNGSSNREHGESSSQNETGNDPALHDPNSFFHNETLKPQSASGDSLGGQTGKGLDAGGAGGGEVDLESLEEGEDEEDEEVHEDGNKAVEWTEDDENNLMDLGLSELERNKRLESLIAKRRARKMFKMAVEKSLMDRDIVVPPSQIAPILIAKNDILDVSRNPSEEGLQVPGSAPSILLPTQNPFDIPYDPLEEKPNLMADSFQQEFMAANQKEMLFCRHESFCRGPLFTFGTTQDPNDAQFNPYYTAEERFAGGPTIARFKKLPDYKGGHHHYNSSGIGSEIDLVELEESYHEKALNLSEGKSEKIRESANDRTEIEGVSKVNPDDLKGSEVRMEIDTIKNNDSCYSSSSSEAAEAVLDHTSKSLGLFSDQVRKAFSTSIPPKGKTVNKLPYDSSPSPRRTQFNLFYNANRKQGHARSCSIASDLQVEVSEVGSPTLSTDGTVSSVDGGSVTYDGDVERDINSDSEELWGGSFNLSRGEANREKLLALEDIIEEDSVEVKSSGLNWKPEEPIASISSSEQEVKQNLNTTSSPSSRVDTTEDGASYPANINRETHEDTKRIDEEDEGFKTFNVSDALLPENPEKSMHLMGEPVVHSPSDFCFEKPEQVVEPQQKPTEELNIICIVKQLITQEDANTLDSKSSATRDDGAQVLIEPAALEEMRNPDEAINLDCSDYRHGNLEISYESKRTMDSEKKIEESQPSKYIEEDTHNLTEHNTGDAPNAVQSRDQPSKYIEDDTQNLTEKSTRDAPNAVQCIDGLESVPDSIVDQNVAEDDVSGVEQRLGGSITTALNRRLEIEQIYLSSSSSPRSVLPQSILADQIPISAAEQRSQTDMPQSVMEDIARDNLADNQPHDNLTFNMPQISQQLVENPINHSSSNCSLGTLEGSSNVTEKSTNCSTFHNMDELILEGTYGKEDSFIKSSDGESKTLMGLKDAEELSKPSGESNPGSIEHLGGSEKLIEYDTGIDPSKSEGNAKSDDPETMVREEVIEEGNIFINKSVVNEKEEGENLTTDQGESQFSVRPEDISGPENSNEHEADVNKTEVNESDDTTIPETAREGEKSAAEVDRICNVNDSLTSNVTNNEILNHVLDDEGEPRMLRRQEAIMEPSKTSGATSAGSVEDTVRESKRLTEAEANAGLSTSEGESNSLNNIKNAEEIQNLTGQKCVVDALQPGEDNLKATNESIPGVGTIATGISIDHKIAMEASKPTESEVKAVDTELNDSNAVAK